MAKKPSKFPYKRTFIRHIYGVGHDGKESLLYSDDITYPIASKRDEDALHFALTRDSTALLDQRIKMKIWEKDERTKKPRRE